MICINFRDFLMILTLYTEDFFDSSHHLCNYEGKCALPHGHTWKVSVWVRGDEKYKDKSGILWDFGNLKQIIKKIDHTNLNELFTESPSAENIAKYIYTELTDGRPELSFKVRVYEKVISKKSYCEIGGF